MSTIISLKKDFMTILGLVMLGVATLGIGLLTSASVKQTHLMRDGGSEALRWIEFLKAHPDTAREIFRTRRLWSPANDIFRKGSLVSRVMAYELFDSTGHRFYSHGPSSWLPKEPSRQLLASPVTRNHIERGRTTTRLHHAENSARVRRYASIVIPFHDEGDYLGSAVAYVNQTRQATILTESFWSIAAATVVLILIAFGIPSALLVSRTRARLRAEEQVQFLSSHDKLTGLPDRNAFTNRLTQALAGRGNGRDKVAVIYIDIDRFKEINDALGHSAGDAVLRCVAERLKSNVRDGDFAARIGSDQFALALTTFKRPEQAAVFAATLSEALSTPYWASGEQITCTVSLGAAVAPADGNDASVLMRHANLALNRAKIDGGNTFKFFERGMDVAFIRRRERETDLRRAIEEHQFEIHYQPQIILGSETVSGHEALLRWEHPVHGRISPAYFIPLAEETELIVPLGEWVLRRACEDATAWPEPLNVAVNLSPAQFKRGNIVELVASVLEETGLDPARLELEITENLLMGNTELVVADLRKLSELGVAIAMDDFGTGYSSLSYLSSFPFNKIKIDKTFVQAMTRDRAILSIVKCIIAMGRSLDVTITAEGVETAEQAQLLKEFGCEQVQGFLYGAARRKEDELIHSPEPVRRRPQKSTSAA